MSRSRSIPLGMPVHSDANPLLLRTESSPRYLGSRGPDSDRRDASGHDDTGGGVTRASSRQPGTRSRRAGARPRMELPGIHIGARAGTRPRATVALARCRGTGVRTPVPARRRPAHSRAGDFDTRSIELFRKNVAARLRPGGWEPKIADVMRTRKTIHGNTLRLDCLYIIRSSDETGWVVLAIIQGNSRGGFPTMPPRLSDGATGGCEDNPGARAGGRNSEKVRARGGNREPSEPLETVTLCELSTFRQRVRK